MRALVFGVETYVDAGLAGRPGTVAGLRRAAERLSQAGYTVRLLVDDAPRDSDRPLLGNLLDALTWLAEDDAPLLLASAHFKEEVLLPRDARLSHLGRTGLALSAVLEAVPDAALVLDGAPPNPTARGARWAVGCDAGPPPDSRGPTPFLRTVGRTLWSGGTEGVRAETLAQAAATHGPAWAFGDLQAQVVGGIEDAPRSCPACAADVPDPAAVFCPVCGASLGGLGTLDNGRYVLLSVLGEGGMGQVYIAEDTRLKVRRAIKLMSLPPDLPQAEVEGLRARMIQEARAAQALAEESHHVVRVFDVGYSPERDEPFLVMELLEGETLTQRLKRGRMTLREALDLGRTIAETLARAHARNIVHRDLKPDNIMLVRRGERDDHVKLLDFGLVKMEHAEVDTASGRMMGTLQYMPPEQLRGQRVDARADVFSLGALLYECLSGVRANPGTTQKAIFAVLLDKGARPLAQVAPSLPDGLADLVDACLRLDRDKRPKDAGEVVRALAQVQVSNDDLAPTLAPTAEPTVSVVNGEVSEVPQVAGKPRVWPVFAVVAAIAAGVFLWPRAPAVQPDAAVAVVVDAAPDVAPAPDAAIPDAAPEPQPVTPPDTLGAADGVSAKVGADVRYSGGDVAARYAAWVRDQRAHGDVDWAGLDEAGRAWLAEGLDPTALRDDGSTLIAPPIQPAPPTVKTVRGVGRFALLGDREPLVLEGWCGGAAAGDRLVTARWSTPGYGNGRCAGPDCMSKLARALHNARSVGESLRVSLALARGARKGDDEAKPRTVRCRIRG